MMAEWWTGDPSGVCVGEWHSMSDGISFWELGHHWRDNGTRVSFCLGHTATHWMPLPKSPQ